MSNIKDVDYLIEKFIKERKSKKIIEKEDEKSVKKIRSQENLDKGRKKNNE